MRLGLGVILVVGFDATTRELLISFGGPRREQKPLSPHSSVPLKDAWRLNAGISGSSSHRNACERRHPDWRYEGDGLPGKEALRRERAR
jgi:hypothetical protein